MRNLESVCSFEEDRSNLKAPASVGLKVRFLWVQLSNLFRPSWLNCRDLNVDFAGKSQLKRNIFKCHPMAKKSELILEAVDLVEGNIKHLGQAKNFPLIGRIEAKSGRNRVWLSLMP